MHELLAEGLSWIQSQAYDESFNDFRLPVPQNIVCTVTLRYPRHHLTKAQKPRVNLREPALYMLNAKRNESEFASLKIKYNDPSATTLTFSTYKMLCIGAKTPAAGQYSLHRSARLLDQYCHWECFRKCRVNNIVLSTNLGHWVDVGRLAAEHQERVDYDPKRFPGCKYTTPVMPGAMKPRCIMLFEAGAFNAMVCQSLPDTRALPISLKLLR